MRILLLFLIVFNFSLFYVKGNNAQDYTIYHQYINKAEEYFYLYNEVDSCLYYYNLAFEDFAFNWVHDLVNATQIAYFSEKEYKPYIHKAYFYGLQAKNLEQIPLFQSDCIDEFKKFEQTQSYQDIRNKYLKSFNIEYLDWIYDFAIEEQIKKEKDDDLVLWWNEHIEKLYAKINQYGFPSNKTIGIESSTIFAELGMPDKDMSERVLKHRDRSVLCYENKPDFLVFGNDTMWVEKDTNVNNCYDAEDNILAVSRIMVCFIHYSGIHNVSNEYYDSVHNQLQTVWLQEISKGNLHPREMAILHDEMHRIADNSSLTKSFESGRKGVGEVFGIYKITTFDGSFDVNEFRAKYHIVSLEIDAKKKEYEKNQGFKLFWGFWGCM